MVDLGEFLRLGNKLKEAISILENAAKLALGNAKLWTNLGTALQQDKKCDDAKIAYEKALTINPKLAEVSSNLGAMAKDAGGIAVRAQVF